MHALTNGDLPSEVVDVELPESQESLEVSVNEDVALTQSQVPLDMPVNGDSVVEELMAADSTQETNWDLDEIKATFEALLFVSHDPLTMEKLASVIEGVPKSTLKITMQTLQAEYEQLGRGLLITEIAGGFVMVTRPGQNVAIKRLSKTKTTSKLSRSALETLAIIGYKQPIARGDIEKIRGVETSGVLRTLLDQKMIRIVGRQEIPGRPMLYGTGKQFLQRFGLRDLRDLPPLKELKELGGSEPLALELPFDSDDQEKFPVVDLSS